MHVSAKWQGHLVRLRRMTQKSTTRSDIIRVMKQELEQAIQALVKELFNQDVSVELTRPDAQFGDFATNVALQLAKQLGKNPREVAEAIQTQLKHENIASVDIAGPGFLNLHLSDSALLNLSKQTPAQTLTGKQIVAEYSDPNPFKPLHAGHLYTTLVGDFISNLLEKAGAKVTRLNYGGDVGRHVAISMWAILNNESHATNINEMAQDAVHGIEARAQEDLHTRAMYLGQMYAQGTEKFETDEESKKQVLEINKRVYQLHDNNDHESAFAQIYWTCRQWSYDYFAMLYEELKVHPFDRFIPESEVTPLGVSTINEQLKKGVYEQSDGAVVFKGEPFGLHTRVFINSEGLPTYEAKDVGLIQLKWQDYHFDESIVITANEQTEYYKVMLKSVEQFAPEIVERSLHLTHGVVKLQGGVKMSSRRGNTVSALDIINAARQAGQKSGRATNEDTVLAAIKYAFAKNRIGGDLIYDPQESISLEGNSGPYLQYAHARARSILQKTTDAVIPTEVEGSFDFAQDDMLQAGERSLLRKIGEFTEVIDKSVQELMPHHVCTYLYELAQEFNRFYEQNRVIDDPRQSVRLELVESYANTLKKGLELLNIPAPERM